MTMSTTVVNALQAQDNPLYQQALVNLLYQLADDDLILGHRDSEWLGLAPEIEEDVAFSSIAQDEVGHATFYYELLAGLGEGDADSLAFGRSVASRRNAQLVERENGDWAHTIVRHYFYDVFEDVRLQALAASSYQPLRQGASKIRREEFYHLMHLEMWFLRLAQGGGEALERMQSAVDVLWGDLDNLFNLGTCSLHLRNHGICSMTCEDIRDTFLARVQPIMAHGGITVPLVNVASSGSQSREVHTTALTDILTTMGEVRDLDLTATW